MMKRVLWVSPYAPYDQVRHAGGQIENYYLKGINMHPEIETRIVTFAYEDEFESAKRDLNKAGIINVVLRNDLDKRDLLSNVLNRIKKYNKYAGITSGKYWDRLYDGMKLCGEFSPDVIVIEWTEFILFIPYIKKIYPNAKIVAVEEDVSFLKYYRTYKNKAGLLKKLSWKTRFVRLKKTEINSLKMADLVILNNYKDEKLVQKYGIINTWRWSPYFNSAIGKVIKRSKSNDIVFFGAMGRPENYESCIWFIQKVMPIIDPKYRFIVIGNKPDEKLLRYKSERVVITGFVEDTLPYFENALCLVAPLVIGAGIKIKILEAMSAGLTVLTNSIGIEGIPANNMIHYIHCENAQEYSRAINMLSVNHDKNIMIGENGKRLINGIFNYENDVDKFRTIINNM